MDLRPVQLDDLAPLRRAKIDSLRVRVFPGQHEEQVRKAKCFRLDEGHAEAGYGIFLESNTDDPELQHRLIEFDVSIPWRGRSPEYLAGLIEELGAGQIEVRTDDATALEPSLELAVARGWNLALLTSIYALETGMLRRPPRPAGVEVKRVAKEDQEVATALLTGAGGAAADAVSLALQEKRLWGLYHGEQLVGAAEVLPAAHHRYADLRPVIHPDSRRGGLATFLTGEISHELLNENHRLMTEATTSEWAWRRMAEKLGLTLAAHRLLLGKG